MGNRINAVRPAGWFVLIPDGARQGYVEEEKIVTRTMKNDPSGSLKALIEKYTVISFIPDIDHYRRIVVPKPGSCIFRGCREPIAWEDARGKNFLCENHFRVMQQWILEARKGLIPGGQSASFRALEDFVIREEPEPADLPPGEAGD